MRRPSRLATEVCCLFVLLASSIQCSGAEVDVSVGNCNDKVHVVARDAPLSLVLARLSEALQFELRYDAESDPIVNVDMARAAPDLVGRLGRSQSIVVTQADDARCPRRTSIVKVWVLSGSGKDAARSAPPSAAHSTPAWSSQQLDDMSGKAKEAYELYVRTHGVPPPGVEEDAAKIKR